MNMSDGDNQKWMDQQVCLVLYQMTQTPANRLALSFSKLCMCKNITDQPVICQGLFGWTPNGRIFLVKHSTYLWLVYLVYDWFMTSVKRSSYLWLGYMIYDWFSSQFKLTACQTEQHRLGSRTQSGRVKICMQGGGGRAVVLYWTVTKEQGEVMLWTGQWLDEQSIEKSVPCSQLAKRTWAKSMGIWATIEIYLCEELLPKNG